MSVKFLHIVQKKARLAKKIAAPGPVAKLSHRLRLQSRLPARFRRLLAAVDDWRKATILMRKQFSSIVIGVGYINS